jgi:hypothetical protein
MTSQNPNDLSEAKKRKQCDNKINVSLSGIKAKMWTYNYDIIASIVSGQERYHCNLNDDDYYRNMHFIGSESYDEMLSLTNSESENGRDFVMTKKKIHKEWTGGNCGIKLHDPVFKFTINQLEEFDFGERVVIVIANCAGSDFDKNAQILLISKKSEANRFRQFSAEMEVLLNSSQPEAKQRYRREKTSYKKTICTGKSGVPTFGIMREAVSEWTQFYKGKENLKNPSDRTDEALFYELQLMIFRRKNFVKRETKSWYDDFEVANPLDDTSAEDSVDETENIELEDTQFENYETDPTKLSDFMNALVQKLQIVDKEQLSVCKDLLLKYTDEPEFQQLPQSPKLKRRTLSERCPEEPRIIKHISRIKSTKQKSAKKLSGQKKSDIVIIEKSAKKLSAKKTSDIIIID